MAVNKRNITSQYGGTYFINVPYIRKESNCIMKKIILLLLVSGGFCASGKAPEETTDLIRKSPTVFAPRSSRSIDETSVHFFYDIDLGYSGMSATGPYAFHQGAFLYGGDIGIRFNVNSKNAATANHVSIAVGGYQANQKSFHSSTLRAQISYTHFGCLSGSDVSGLYWQIGILPTYLYTVTDKNSNDYSNHANRLFFEPMVSFGFHTLFTMVSRHTRNELGGGRVFVGPFLSYGIGNLSKDAGETINPGYKIGVKWSYVF